MRLNKTALAAVATVLLIGCTQASIETPSIDSSASAKTLADAAFNDAATVFPLVYTNNDTTGTVTPVTGVVVSGTSPAPSIPSTRP
jgi:hypothetical protein